MSHAAPGDAPPRWPAWLVAALAGALLPLAFPPVGASWLALVGVAPLLLVLRTAPTGWEAAGRGVLAGAAFFVVLLHWLLPVAGWSALPALAVLGLLWAPWAVLGWRVLRPPLRPWRVAAALLLLPAGWVATEYLRAWDAFVGPWGLLGATQWDVGALLPLAALAGVWLLSFLLVLVNVAIAVAVAPDAPSAVRLLGAGAAAAAVLVALTAAAAYEPPEPTGERLRVAGVQPGTIEGVPERVAVQAALTAGLDVGADLVVWGQRSAPFDPPARPALVARVQAAAGAAAAPVLVSVDPRGAEGTYRTALLLSRGGVQGRYDKTRFVPFDGLGPLGGVLRFVTPSADAAEAERRRGEDLVLFEVAGVQVGPLIGDESLYPDLRRALVALGADATVVQGGTPGVRSGWAEPQQASVEAVRAVESGRSALLATVSGTSSAFDPSGRQLVWVGPGVRGTYVVDLPLTRGATPYVRFGDWLPIGCVALLLGAGFAADARLPRRRP